MKRPVRRTRRHPLGFTLVEVLVALTIFAVVMLVISSVLRSSNRAHQRTVRQAEMQTDLRQALDLITTEVREAGSDPSIPAAGIVPIVYADSVTLHVRSDLDGDGAIQAMDRSTGTSEDVTYSWKDSTKALSRNPGPGSSVIMPNVLALRFRYYDANGQPIIPVPLTSSTAALVHSITVAITAGNRDSLPITDSTRITLRNQ